jgi:hypothetical protein
MVTTEHSVCERRDYMRRYVNGLVEPDSCRATLSVQPIAVHLCLSSQDFMVGNRFCCLLYSRLMSNISSHSPNSPIQTHRQSEICKGGNRERGRYMHTYIYIFIYCVALHVVRADWNGNRCFCKLGIVCRKPTGKCASSQRRKAL